MKIALILPVHNEEKMIVGVLEELILTNINIFIVDDGSTDSTSRILNNFVKDNKQITILSHKINLGKGAALKTGCLAAFKNGFSAVVFMDSDGQHKVSDIEKFTSKLESGNYDMVLGSRNLHHGVPLVRFMGNKIASVLISLLFGVYVSDILCGFRAITKKSYLKMNFESSGYGIETEMIVKISKNKLRTCEVPVDTIYHDKHKGVTILDAFSIFFDVLRWRIIL